MVSLSNGFHVRIYISAFGGLWIGRRGGWERPPTFLSQSSKMIKGCVHADMCECMCVLVDGHTVDLSPHRAFDLTEFQQMQ